MKTDGGARHDENELDALARRFVASAGADPDGVVATRGEERAFTQVETLFALEPDLDAEELAVITGLSLEDLDDVTRALGMPSAVEPGKRYRHEDVELVRASWRMVDQFPDREVGLRLLRVVASSMARSAEASVAAYIDAVQRPMWNKGVTRLDHARSQAVAVGNVKEFGDQLGILFVHHLAAAVRRTRAARVRSPDLDTSVMAVGFVDLAGFTPMSHELPNTELARVIADFEKLAFDIAVDFGGMVVKHVGDEVMFVAIDPLAACEIALALVVRASEANGAIAPHAGVAYGNLISSGGDYYGVDVNLAARLADEAVPHEVLVSAELAEIARHRSDELQVEPAGRRALKGFPEPVEVFSISLASD